MKANFLKRLQVTAAIAAIASAGTLSPFESFAESDGTLGATSTGTVGISVTKPAQANISGMLDMSLGSWTVGSGDVALDTTACVYSTGAVGSTAGDYTILATGGQNGAGAVGTAFYLNDGVVSALASHNIPYTVTWHANGTGTGGTGLTANMTSGQFTGADTVSATCTDAANNVQVNIGITAPNMEAAAAGTFTDTVTLLISPD